MGTLCRLHPSVQIKAEGPHPGHGTTRRRASSLGTLCWIPAQCSPISSSKRLGHKSCQAGIYIPRPSAPCSMAGFPGGALAGMPLPYSKDMGAKDGFAAGFPFPKQPGSGAKRLLPGLSQARGELVPLSLWDICHLKMPPVFSCTRV